MRRLLIPLPFIILPFLLTTCEEAAKEEPIPENTVVPVLSVLVEPKELTLTEGETAQIEVAVLPEDATDKTVTWSSLDPSVASVSNGMVSAVKAGSAVISAKAGEKTADCRVTVNKRIIQVESITLDRDELELVEGDEAVLTASVLPEDATDKTVTWSSSDTAVANVVDGKVTAIMEGMATILAKAADKEASCKVTVAKRVIEVVSVALDLTELELVEGDEAVLTATVLPENATDKTVSWNSSDPTVATVVDGLVTAKKEGTATVSARAGEKEASCKVTVAKQVIEVVSVTLDRTELELVEGEDAMLTAKVLPENATDKTVAWSSSDPAIASVVNGKVTAKKEGTATITASAGEKSASCAVTIKKKVVPVSSISLNKNKLTLTKGRSELLTATVYPDNATDKSVTWSSSNTAIAMVTENGLVTAMGAGTATITASAGGKQATCAVTVTVPVESVYLDCSSVVLEEGEYAMLTASVYPADATDKTVTWSTSDASVATVGGNGRIYAQKEGIATITAKAGEKSAGCEVTVKKKTIPVSMISLSQSYLGMSKGSSTTLSAWVYPENATDKTVTWSSSDNAVASVDQNGMVTALSAGNATITAEAGGKQATCHVVVVVPVESFDLRGETTIYVGDSVTWWVENIYPEDATDKTVTWYVYKNPEVASVDANGVVTGLSVGQAIIMARIGWCGHGYGVSVLPSADAVTLNITEASLKVGESVQLSATVTAETQNQYYGISWMSSDESVAIVSSSGLVVGKKKGQAVITAKAGGKRATCTVTVNGEQGDLGGGDPEGFDDEEVDW